MRKKGNPKRMLCVLLACTLVIGMCVTVYGAVARATTMRLAATSGTRVTLKTLNGTTRRITNGMRLYNGNIIETGSGSYAYISLDSSKAVKVDANARVQVRQDGKKLKLLVNRGKLFFNVNVPLKSDESLDVQTSTMVTGVRGTCGVIEAVSSDTANVYLLEGALEIDWKNPETGKSEPVALKSGEKLTLTKNAATAPAATTLAPEEVPAFAAEEVAKDTALQQKITEMGGPDVSKIIETVQPEKPVQPVTPVQPDPPVQPVQPDPPVQPEKPTTPVQPEKPVQPTEPLKPEMPKWDLTAPDVKLIDLDQMLSGTDIGQMIMQAFNDVKKVYVKGGTVNTTNIETLSINDGNTLVLSGVTVTGREWTIDNNAALYIDMDASLQLTGSIKINEKGTVYSFSTLKADKKEGTGKVVLGGYGKLEETSKSVPGNS